MLFCQKIKIFDGEFNKFTNTKKEKSARNQNVKKNLNSEFH